MFSQDFVPWPDNLAQKYREQGYWNGQTLCDLLTMSAHQYTENTALICGEKHWSYAELYHNVRCLARGFADIGLQTGDMAIVQLPNCGEFVEIIFALFSIGVVPIMALPAHRQFELSYFARHANAKTLITTSRYKGFNYQQLAEQVQQESHIKHVVIVDSQATHEVRENNIPLSELYHYVAPENVALSKNIPASALAVMQLSGGTTNLPKLIPRTHEDYFYSVRQSALICQLSEWSVFLCVLPSAHNFTLSSPGILGVLFAGGTVVLDDAASADAVFPLIERHKVTLTAAVPPLAISWMHALQNQHFLGESLQSLRVLQVGGAKLSPEAARKLGPTFGCTLQQVFGMAEGLVNYTRLDDNIETIVNTQGRPMSDGDEVRVVDDDDKPVAVGQTGHLLTRGPYTIRGYYRAPEHNQLSFTSDGYYRTGDMVRVTEQGYLIVEGRAKDQINRGGEKISAEEVENQMLAHPDVQDVAVVSIPDIYLGERICVCLILKDVESKIRLIKNVRKFLREKGLAEFKLPDVVHVLPQFPFTGFGKVSKKELRKMMAVQYAQAETA